MLELVERRIFGVEKGSVTTEEVVVHPSAGHLVGLRHGTSSYWALRRAE
jgi:hypothetical protein